MPRDSSGYSPSRTLSVFPVKKDSFPQPKFSEVIMKNAKNRMANQKKEKNQSYTAQKRALLNYKFFVDQLRMGGIGLKPRVLSKRECEMHVQEVYHDKFRHILRSKGNETFLEFYWRHMRETHRPLKHFEQTILNVLVSVEQFKEHSYQISIFSNFLQEIYDKDDAFFFLFLRDLIENDLQIKFFSSNPTILNVSQLSHGVRVNALEAD